MGSLGGFVLLLLMLGLLSLGLSADKHYRHLHTLGRQDYIKHKDRTERLEGLARWSYRRGRVFQKNLMADEDIM